MGSNHIQINILLFNVLCDQEVQNAGTRVILLEVLNLLKVCRLFRVACKAIERFHFFFRVFGYFPQASNGPIQSSWHVWGCVRAFMCVCVRHALDCKHDILRSVTFAVFIFGSKELISTQDSIMQCKVFKQFGVGQSL